MSQPTEVISSLIFDYGFSGQWKEWRDENYECDQPGDPSCERGAEEALTLEMYKVFDWHDCGTYRYPSATFNAILNGYLSRAQC